MKNCRKQNRDLLKTLCNRNRILRPRIIRKHNLTTSATTARKQIAFRNNRNQLLVEENMEIHAPPKFSQKSKTQPQSTKCKKIQCKHQKIQRQPHTVKNDEASTIHELNKSHRSTFAPNDAFQRTVVRFVLLAGRTWFPGLQFDEKLKALAACTKVTV